MERNYTLPVRKLFSLWWTQRVETCRRHRKK